MSNVLPPAGPTLLTHFVMTMRISHSHTVPVQLFPELQVYCTCSVEVIDTRAVNLPSTVGARSIAEAHSSCAVLAWQVQCFPKASVFTCTHNIDTTKVSGCTAAQIDLLPINSKLVTGHLGTLDKYRKCSRLSG